LGNFTARGYRVRHDHRDGLPARLQATAPRMAAHDWLGSYSKRANVDDAVRGIANRLSRNGDKLVACLEVLRNHEPSVDATFEMFFPDLIESAARMRTDGVFGPHPHDEEH
jgi:acyl carrier protein phosphodiesterase